MLVYERKKETYSFLSVRSSVCLSVRSLYGLSPNRPRSLKGFISNFTVQVYNNEVMGSKVMVTFCLSRSLVLGTAYGYVTMDLPNENVGLKRCEGLL